MASDIEIKLKPAGFRAIMQSGEMQAVVGRSASAMESAAESMSDGDVNYLSNVQNGRVSAHGMVATGDRHAQKSNAKHNTLRKSIDAGRV